MNGLKKVQKVYAFFFFQLTTLHQSNSSLCQCESERFLVDFTNVRKLERWKERGVEICSGL